MSLDKFVRISVTCDVKPLWTFASAACQLGLSQVASMSVAEETFAGTGTDSDTKSLLIFSSFRLFLTFQGATVSAPSTQTGVE